MKASGRVLSIDPSLRCAGIVGWEDGLPTSVTCVRTEREAKKRRIYVGDDDCRRLLALVNVLKAYQLNGYHFAVAEQPAGSQSYRGAKAEGMMLGVLTAIFEGGLAWVQARDVKKAATGSYKAEKSAMVGWAKDWYPGQFAVKRTKPENEAIADALAVMKAYQGVGSCRS